MSAEDLGCSSHRIERLGARQARARSQSRWSCDRTSSPPIRSSTEPDPEPSPATTTASRTWRCPRSRLSIGSLDTGAGAGARRQRGQVGRCRRAREVGSGQDEGGELLVGPAADVVGQAARTGGRRRGVGVGGRTGGHEGNGNRHFGDGSVRLGPAQWADRGARTSRRNRDRDAPPTQPVGPGHVDPRRSLGGGHRHRRDLPARRHRGGGPRGLGAPGPGRPHECLRRRRRTGQGQGQGQEQQRQGPGHRSGQRRPELDPGPARRDPPRRGHPPVRRRGGTETLLVQTGEVTASSDTALTVRSTDGFTETYAVAPTTTVRGPAKAAGLAVGTQVTVVATKDGKSALLVASKGGPS